MFRGQLRSGRSRSIYFRKTLAMFPNFEFALGQIAQLASFTKSETLWLERVKTFVLRSAGQVNSLVLGLCGFSWNLNSQSSDRGDRSQGGRSSAGRDIRSTGRIGCGLTVPLSRPV